MWRFAIALIMVCTALGLSGEAVSSATAFSTDGEATVYRAADFRGDFTLRYRAALGFEPRNQSWSTLSVTLLGGAPPADAITVGLFPDGRSTHVFTSIEHGGVSTFRDTLIVCSPACDIGLHGDRGSISAIVAGKAVNSWPRFAFSLPHPTLQLNAEVSGAGDRIEATLLPLEERAGRQRLPKPLCGFTTQGVMPAAESGLLRFSGSFARGAAARYIDLRDGRRLERCPSR